MLSRIVKLKRQTVEPIPGAAGRGNGGLLFNRCRASVWEDEKFLEMDGGGGGCTAL